MYINFKNILAGIGTAIVVLSALYIGLLSKANTEYMNDSQIKIFENEDGTVSLGAICPLNEYALRSSFKLASTNYVNSSIDIDGNNNILRLGLGVQEFEVFDINGKAKKGVYPYDTPIYNAKIGYGFFIDKEKNLVYVPGNEPSGQGDSARLYIFKINSNGDLTPADPAFWDNIFASHVVAKGNYVYTLSDIKKENKNFYIKKYDLKGKLISSMALPFGVNAYYDMSIGQDGTIYVPMNLVEGILYKKYENGQEVKYYKYRYISTVLKYNQDLVLLNPSTNTQPRDLNDFKFDTFSFVTEEHDANDFDSMDFMTRFSIDQNGNMITLYTKYYANTHEPDLNNQNTFKIFDKDGKLIKYWQESGLTFHDFASDAQGNIYAIYKDTIYKFSIKCGEINVTKDTVPDDNRDFTFENDFGYIHPPRFSLDDDADPKISNTQSFDFWDPFDLAKTFNLSEIADPLYNTEVQCTDPSGETKTTKLSAAIKLNTLNQGKVRCLFTNTFVGGKITIKKNTIPDNNEIFEFSKSWEDGFFSLFDNGDDRNNSKSFFLVAGKYNIAEITKNYLLGGYTTTVECVDQKGEVIVAKKRAIEVDLDLKSNQEIICTFTNTKKDTNSNG